VESVKRSPSPVPPLNRRDFIKRAAMGTAGFALASSLPGLSGNNGWADPKTSRVVIVTDQAASSGTSIVTDVAAAMMDSGIMELTGETAVGGAWKSLFPDITPASRIGIKVNCINRYLSSHPEVVSAIVAGLARMEVGKANFPRNNIVVWDRYNYEMSRSGYTNYTGSDADTHRCFATDQPGIGYDGGASIAVNGVTCYPSSILTQHIDYLINVSVLKNHTIAGATGALKNHYGSIHNPGALHGSYGQYCDPFIPALNQQLFDQLNVRQVVNICDAIFGIYTGGPMGSPQVAHNGLLFSTDPVALDYQALQILIGYGCGTATMATHIDTAAWPPYELGTSDPGQMDVRYITDPSTEVPERSETPARPADYRLELAYPNPFNARTVIPYHIGGQRSVSARLEVFNVRGQRVRTLFGGRKDPGRYQAAWDGRDDRGAAVSSGVYVCRLTAAGHAYSIKLSLLR
jgi:uncharacterized protein (DUF362 family)